MCQLMAIEMGPLDAIVKRKDQSVNAYTLANEINREELLIGSNHSVLPDRTTANGFQYAS